jgi:hypothetical protein
VKLGREIARFEQRVWANQLHGRVYMISLRECDHTLYRTSDPSNPKITNAWRRVRGWAVKFKSLEVAKADYIHRGYVEVLVTGSASPA